MSFDETDAVAVYMRLALQQVSSVGFQTVSVGFQTFSRKLPSAVCVCSTWIARALPCIMLFTGGDSSAQWRGSRGLRHCAWADGTGC